jgi:hypothetical protein
VALVSSPAAAGVVPTLALPITTAATGLTAGNTDGRAVFDGNSELALATPLSGGIAPSRSWGAGPLAAVPIAGLRGTRHLGRSLGSNSDPGAAGLGVLSSRPSDLLTDFKPFEKGSLEAAIDRFLDKFDDLGTEMTRLRGPTDLLTEIMAVAVALTAAKVGLRLFWRPRDDEADLLDPDTDLCVKLDPFPSPLDL